MTKPNKELITVLTDLLTRVQNGELTGMAFVVLAPNRSWQMETVGDCSREAAMTIGLLELLQADLMEAIRETWK